MPGECPAFLRAAPTSGVFEQGHRPPNQPGNETMEHEERNLSYAEWEGLPISKFEDTCFAILFYAMSIGVGAGLVWFTTIKLTKAIGIY